MSEQRKVLNGGSNSAMRAVKRLNSSCKRTSSARNTSKESN